MENVRRGRPRSPIGRVTQARPVQCDRCGTPHERCLSHKTLEDGRLTPCKAWPIKGAEVCGAHGGKAPQVKAAAAARMAEDKARWDISRYGGSIEIDPATALLQEVQRSAGAVEYWRMRVSALPEDELTWGVVEETDKPITDTGGGTEVKRKAAPHVLVVMYQQERKHLATVCKAALDAGATATLVDVFKQTASTYVQLVGRVLDQVIANLDLSEEQRSRTPGLVQAAFESELQGIAGVAEQGEHR